eukprot:Polyplicarium_translucidae@DN4093_c0_g1_i1.p1
MVPLLFASGREGWVALGPACIDDGVPIGGGNNRTQLERLLSERVRESPICSRKGVRFPLMAEFTLRDGTRLMHADPDRLVSLNECKAPEDNEASGISCQLPRWIDSQQPTFEARFAFRRRLASDLAFHAFWDTLIGNPVRHEPWDIVIDSRTGGLFVRGVAGLPLRSSPPQRTNAFTWWPLVIAALSPAHLQFQIPAALAALGSALLMSRAPRTRRLLQMCLDAEGSTDPDEAGALLRSFERSVGGPASRRPAAATFAAWVQAQLQAACRGS